MLCSGDRLNCKRARKQNLKTCSMRIHSYEKREKEIAKHCIPCYAKNNTADLSVQSPSKQQPAK